MKKNALPAFLMLILFAALIRLWFNHGRELWLDEIVTLLLSKGSFAQVIQEHQRTSAPPFYGILLNIFVKTIADGGITRLISWVAGVLAVPVAYQVGHALKDTKLGWLLAFTVAIHSVFVQYSMELREYSWVVLLTLLWFWTFHFTVKSPKSSGYIFFYMGVSAWCIWTQYGLAIMVGIGTLILGYIFYQQKQLKKFILLVLWIVANVVVIYFLTLRHQLGVTQGEYLSGKYGLNPLLLFGNTLELLVFASGGIGFPTLLIGLYVGWQVMSLEEKFLLTGTWIAVVCLSFITLYPYGGIRQDMFLAVLILITGVAGLRHIATSHPRLFFTLVLVLWMTAFGSLIIDVRWTHKGNFSEFNDEIAERAGETTPVVAQMADAIMWQYYNQDKKFFLISSKNIVADVENCLKQYTYCWYISYGEELIKDEIEIIKTKHVVVQEFSPQKGFRALLLKQ